MLRVKHICCCLVSGMALGAASTASAQTLLAPDALQLSPTQTYTTPAPQLAPPPVFLPSGPTYPVETRRSVRPRRAPVAPLRQPSLVPEYDLHGFAPLPAGDTPYVPGMTSPSISAWSPVQQPPALKSPAEPTPVVPKQSQSSKTPATIQTVVPQSAGGPTRPVDIRTPSAARVWQAMGRFR